MNSIRRFWVDDDVRKPSEPNFHKSRCCQMQDKSDRDGKKLLRVNIVFAPLVNKRNSFFVNEVSGWIISSKHELLARRISREVVKVISFR